VNAAAALPLGNTPQKPVDTRRGGRGEHISIPSSKL